MTIQVLIRKMSKKFPRFPQPQKPLENLWKRRKPQYLETYVTFCGNLWEISFPETSGNLETSENVWKHGNFLDIFLM